MMDCKKCGVVFNEDIAQIEKYKEYEGYGCRIYATKCPVCKNKKLIDTYGQKYAFDEDEINDLLMESV